MGKGKQNRGKVGTSNKNMDVDGEAGAGWTTEPGAIIIPWGHELNQIGNFCVLKYYFGNHLSNFCTNPHNLTGAPNCLLSLSSRTTNDSV
jgi:hypothetical protein